jgi:DNA polymerase III delta subunit
MIYVLYGKNTQKSRQKLQELVRSLTKKKPDAALVRIDKDNWDKAYFESLVESSGLFESKCIAVLDRLLEEKGSEETVLDAVSELQRSENIFIVIEEALSKKASATLKKVDVKIQEFEGTAKRKSEFSIFSLTDALGKKDRRGLWVLYEKALAKGVSTEEIHGILVWQLKAIILAGNSATVKESGLSPFVYTKSKTFSMSFEEGEAEKLLKELVVLYHEARRGAFELETGLERFVLNV